MKITLLAHTVARLPVFDTLGVTEDADYDTSIDHLHEFAGRACYQSFHKPNPGTATNESYMANIIAQGHFSVLEHGSATFYVEGVSRSLTHELIRHRHLSFSELSQRFVNMSDTEIVIPPALRDLAIQVDGNTDDLTAAIKGDFDRGPALDYEDTVTTLEQFGLPRKQAREAARAFLPNMVETKIVVTGNMRAWREVIAKRNSPHADAEIQEFAQGILAHLRDIAPNSVADLL